MAKKKLEDFEQSASKEKDKESLMQDSDAAKMSKNTSTISKKDKLLAKKEDKQVKT